MQIFTNFDIKKKQKIIDKCLNTQIDTILNSN